MEKKFKHISDNLSVEILPNGKFEFLMYTNETAKGFGVSGNTVCHHKMEHADELIGENTLLRAFKKAIQVEKLTNIKA